MINKKDFFLLSIIFSVAFLTRFLYFHFLQGHYFFVEHPSSDVAYYQHWANQILVDGWIGKMPFWGLPLFPYFLATLKAITFHNPFIVHTFLFLMGATNCLLLFFVGLKIFTKPIAYFASILLAFNFSIIFYDWLMMPVTLLIFLNLMAILALLDLRTRESPCEWFLLGLILGLALLGDAKFLFFVLLLVIYLLYQNQKVWLRTLQKIILPLFLGFMLLPAIVTIRNKIATDDWLFICGQGGFNFYLGNNPQTTGVFKDPTFIRPTHEGHDEDQHIIAEQVLNKRLKPSEVSAFWLKRGLKHITQSPEIFLNLISSKTLAFMRDDENSYEIDLLLQKRWKDRCDFNPYRLVFPLAFIGIILGYVQRRQTTEINLLILSQLLIIVISFASDRLRASILPFLVLYEAFAIFWFADQILQRQYKKIFIFTGGFLVLSFLSVGATLDQRNIDFLRLSKSGPILVERGQSNEAEKAYQDALNIIPNDPNTLYNLGTLYASQARYHEAMNCFHQVLQINPWDPNTFYNLGFCYLHQGETNTALEHFETVIRLQPSSMDAYYQMANIYSLQGRCDVSEQYYRKIIENTPNLSAEITALIQKCQSL